MGNLVLIIDDDAIFQFTIKRELIKNGIADEIIPFSDGAEAISYIKENLSRPDRLPDMILLDINMPIMDGWEFLKEYELLKSTLNKVCPIYMVSSSLDESDILKAKQIEGVEDFLSKPIDKTALSNVAKKKK